MKSPFQLSRQDTEVLRELALGGWIELHDNPEDWNLATVWITNPRFRMRGIYRAHAMRLWKEGVVVELLREQPARRVLAITAAAARAAAELDLVSKSVAKVAELEDEEVLEIRIRYMEEKHGLNWKEEDDA